MRAILLREFGPPERLEPSELPEPEVAAGELLIDVEVANVTFVETQIRAGNPPHPGMAPELPVVPGNGVGGVVAAVGEGVDPGLVGRRMVSSLRGMGGYAERAVAPLESVIEVPDGLAMPDAVAVLSDGRTALLALRATRPGAGETALVLAAGGGVGSLLVQLALQAGAGVVAAVGSERKLALARSLGAERAVDYTREGWADDVGQVDVVFDGVGGPLGQAAFERLRPGGRLLRFGMASGAFSDVSAEEAAARSVDIVGEGPPPPGLLRELAGEAVEMAAAGRLRPTIGQTFPLEQAGEAHAAIEARATLGKTLLVVA